MGPCEEPGWCFQRHSALGSQPLTQQPPHTGNPDAAAAGVLRNADSSAPVGRADLFQKAAGLDGSDSAFGYAPSKMTSRSLQHPAGQWDEDSTRSGSWRAAAPCCSASRTPRDCPAAPSSEHSLLLWSRGFGSPLCRRGTRSPGTRSGALQPGTRSLHAGDRQNEVTGGDGALGATSSLEANPNFQAISVKPVTRTAFYFEESSHC